MCLEEELRKKQEKQRWDRTRQTIMSQEMDDVFTFRDELELFDDNQQKDYNLKRRMRLEGMKQACTITAPKFEPKERVYAANPKSAFRSASKRQKEIDKGEKTILGKRTINKGILEERERESLHRRSLVEERIADLNRDQAEAAYRFTEIQKRSLAGFMDGTANDNTLLAHYHAGGAERKLAVEACLKKFMKIDLAAIDVSSDNALVENAGRLTELRDQLFSIKTMMQENPKYWNGVYDDAKELYDMKLEQAQKLVDYYNFKIQVLMDPYYVSHLNEEIPFRYNESDPPEVRALCFKIMMAEATEKRLDRKTAALLSPNLPDPDMAETARLKGKMPPAVPTEFGKNSSSVYACRHDTFIHPLAKDDAVMERLVKKHYRVTGEEIESAEEFTRHLYCLLNLRASHHMPEGAMKRMIALLTARPADPTNDHDVQEAATRNLAGMRMFVDLISKQIDYLNRKYGKGFTTIKMQDVADHLQEFECDFTNQQGYSSFLDYCAHFPFFTKEDEKVRLMYKYYEAAGLAVGGSSGMFILEDDMTVAATKQFAADSMIRIASSSESTFLMKDERSDIDWTTTFQSGMTSPLEVVQFLKTPSTFAAFKKKFYESHPQDAVIHWYNLFPGLEALGQDSDTVARKLMDADLDAEKAFSLEEWRADESGEEACIKRYVAEHASMIRTFVNDSEPADPDAAAMLREFRASFEKIEQAARA